MFYLLKKDVLAVLSSLMGWGTIMSFFILMGGYVWVVEGNVLDFGFAELSVFFNLSPWFFLFLVPALSMNSISEEIDRGTFSLVRSLPISLNRILFSKLSAIFIVILITLLPSLLFVYSISQLGLPRFNFDSSLIIGGYCALVLLNLAFVSLGLLASSLTSKQPFAFLLGVSFNFFFWLGGKELGIELTDLSSPYGRMSMGLLNIGDVLFFCGFVLFLSGLIRIRLNRII